MAVLALLIALPLSAQTSLSGMVRDESGKALGNVMVRAYNQHKKLKRYAQTNRQGELVFGELLLPNAKLSEGLGDYDARAPR